MDSVLIRFLSTERKLSLREIARKTDLSPATIMRVLRDVKRLSFHRSHGENTPLRRGRRQRLTDRQQRLIIRTLYKLRRTEGNFTARRIMKEVNISETDVSLRTVRRFINSKGFWYLQARKKGLLTDNDRKNRVAFAIKMRQEHGPEYWTDEVEFYLDGVSFAYKINPLDQARAPSGRIYRKKSEGLNQYCTAKGSKVGTGGKVAKFLVAISYDAGVVLCKEYEHMTGQYFASFIDANFDQMFQKSNKATRLFLQDNDPCQNSRVAKSAWERANAELVAIPSKSPELNPAENLFKAVREDLRTEAQEKEIERETFAEFKERVRDKILSFPVPKINNLIESMDKRLRLIIERKGQRLTY